MCAQMSRAACYEWQVPMKRDVRLHGLSSDHHHALVLARTIQGAFAAGHADQSLIDMVIRDHRAILMHHFDIEEQLLLPPLQAAGEGELVTQVLTEHTKMRGYLQGAEVGELGLLENFAALLIAHIRFEERRLFPTCEQLLEADVLAAVATLAPKPSPK